MLLLGFVQGFTRIKALRDILRLHEYISIYSCFSSLRGSKTVFQAKPLFTSLLKIQICDC